MASERRTDLSIQSVADGHAPFPFATSRRQRLHEGCRIRRIPRRPRGVGLPRDVALLFTTTCGSPTRAGSLCATCLPVAIGGGCVYLREAGRGRHSGSTGCERDRGDGVCG